MIPTTPQLDMFAPPLDGFSATEGKRRRDHGIAAVKAANGQAIALIREYLKNLSRPVHVDDARRYVNFIGLRLTSGNAYGCIFRERGWRQTGEWRASEFIENRGHRSPMWEWKP